MCVVHVGDLTEVGLCDGVRILVGSLETKSIRDRGEASRDVCAGGEMYLVEHVIIKVVLVRPNASLFERITGQSHGQILPAVRIAAAKSVNVSGVSRWIEHNE